jgi:ribosomal protein S12 methylthiotransferase
VTQLRAAVPDIAIRTTAIVGFPGETDDDFRTLCQFAEEIGFERLGVFTYSPQEGTRAAQYPDDVPDELKHARQDELVEIQRAISGERLERFVGRTTEVVAPRMWGGSSGRRTTWTA